MNTQNSRRARPRRYRHGGWATRSLDRRAALALAVEAAWAGVVPAL